MFVPQILTLYGDGPSGTTRPAPPIRVTGQVKVTLRVTVRVRFRFRVTITVGVEV